MSTGAGDFDPYRKWLGIPKENQPPNHYQLLGISPKEFDAQTIEAAYDQRSHYVIEQRGLGLENEVNTVLLELQEAKITLLDPQKREAYDKRLLRLRHQQLQQAQTHSRHDVPLDYQDVQQDSGTINRTHNIDTGIVKMFAGLFAVLAIGMGAMFWWANQVVEDPTKTGKEALVEDVEGKQGIGNGPAPNVEKDNLEPNATSGSMSDANQTQVSNVTVQKPQVTRLILSVDEYGAGSVSVKQVADEYILPESIRGFSIPTLPLSKFYQLPDRNILSIHDFLETDPVETIFSYQTLNAKKLLGQPVIEMTPKPEEGFDVGRVSQLTYGRRLKLPLRIVCDLSRFDGAGFGFKLHDPATQWGLIQFKMWGPQFERQVSWVQKGENEELDFENLVDEKTPFDLKTGITHPFQLPLSPGRITQALVVDLSAFQVNAEAPQLTSHLRRVVIEGDLRPSFGFAMEIQGNQIVVTNVLPDSSAEDAGLLAGDVIRRIKRITPENIASALDLLQKASIGDAVDFEIQRNGRSMSLKVIGG